MDSSHSAVAHHFDDIVQQRQAGELGMWVFLVTEIMFFGGMFMGYLAYRIRFEEGFIAASQFMDVTIGTVNTAVLLCSSLTMALAVYAAEHRHRKALIGLLAATLVLGLVFLVVKAYEYNHKYHEHHMPFLGLPFQWEGENAPQAAMFFTFYFIMTGMHAVHMIIGAVLLLTLIVLAWRGGLLGDRSIVVHNAGLYWHFVDIVWVYLFPFFYLVGE